MAENKFIKIIKSISDEERKRFADFIFSPYFNKSTSVGKLYRTLTEYAPTFVNFSKQKVFKKLYPEKKYNDTRIRNLLSNLYRLYEEFITYENFGNDKLEKHKQLLEAFNEKNLDQQFNKYLTDLENEKNFSRTYQADDYFLYRLLFQAIKVNHILNKDTTVNFNEIQNLQNSSVNYSIVQLLKIYVLMFYTKNNVSGNYYFDYSLLDEIIEYIKKTPFNDIPIINIYYNMLMLWKEGDDKYYDNLTTLLDENYEYISPHDRYGIYFNLINYLIISRTSHSNVETINRKLFNMYKLMVEKKIYKDGGFQYLNDILYINIITNALRVRESKWTEKFINDYKNELPPRHLSDSFNLGYAILFTHEGRFNEALEILSKLRVRGASLQIKIKVLIIRIYYELEYLDSIISLIDNFKHFLSENKSIILRDKITHYNFINFVNKIIKIKINPGHQDIVNLRREIIEAEEIIEKEWLIEKIDKLKDIADK